MKTMIEMHSQLALCTSSIAQHAALAALTGPQDVVEEMRKDYEERRNVIVGGLNGAGLKIKPPMGSFYAYANIEDLGLTGLEFAKRLAKDGRVLGYPGTAFTHDESGSGYIRFAYTKPAEDLKKAAERIQEIVKSL
jgi:aspartate/methionine/tyrosine aminotransferase